MRPCFYILFFFACLLPWSGQGKDLPDFSKIADDKLIDTLNIWCSNNLITAQIPYDSAVAGLDQLTQQGVNSGNKQLELFGRFYNSVFKAEKLKSHEETLKAEAVVLEFEKNGFMHAHALSMHELAIQYLRENNFAKSLELQLRSYECYQKLGLTETHEVGIVRFDLASLYYNLGNNVKCLELLLPNAKNISLSPDGYLHYVTVQTHNTIGLAYRDMNKFDSAIIWFERTRAIASDTRDTIWIGIASGNIGASYIMQQQFTKALPYIKLFHHCAWINTDRVTDFLRAEAFILWAQINLNRGNTAEALQQLKLAESLSDHEIQYSYANQKLIARMFTEMQKGYMLQGDFANALKYTAKADTLRTIMQTQYNQAMYSNIQVQLEAEKNIAALRGFEAHTRLSIQRRNFSLIALALIGLFVFTLYNRQRLKNRKDRELHQSREQLLHSEKMRAEGQLAGYVENLHEKNRIIEGFETERGRLQLLPHSIEKLQTLETIEKLQKSTIITEDEWVQFKFLFDKVHKGFFERLKEIYPDLTQAEMRLLALTKLNLSTKEMAGILGISPESIRKARYRFLKKINDASSEEDDLDLAQIINSI